MKTVTKSVVELIKSGESPLPLSVIPNNMGINLCSVEAMSWTKQGDQLVSLTVHFVPNYDPKPEYESVRNELNTALVKLDEVRSEYYLRGLLAAEAECRRLGSTTGIDCASAITVMIDKELGE
ncbi:MAG: hypothetical protein KGL39_24715 [Patescibacteria group bacterium]|nr:hypothetical protein [Patescibacteria group bacterium]